MKKLLAVGVIVLFIGLAFTPSINANISKASVDSELVEVIKKNAVEPSSNKSSISQRDVVYFDAFVITFIRGDIDYWEIPSGGGYRVFPINVIIGGLWADVWESGFDFWYMKVRIPPDFGWDWRIVMERFIGKLDDDTIYGIAIWGAVSGFGD